MIPNNKSIDESKLDSRSFFAVSGVARGGGGHMSPGAGIRGRQNRREMINYFANVKSRTGT